MTNQSLLALLMARTQVVLGPEGQWQCEIDDIRVMCVTDLAGDRMRFMSPIGPTANFSREMLKSVLEADFHSALDARLAIHDDVLWSLFVCPFSLLTHELASVALDQVVTLAGNAAHGDFHSGPWHFMGDPNDSA